MMGANKLVLGTVQFGCQYGINSEGRPNQEMVSHILEEAYTQGIKTLDTSSAYGDAEQVLGNCIHSDANFRIVSKYPPCDLSVPEAFNASLDRLKKQNLYGYLMHHFSVYESNPKVWNDFLMLRDKGLVKRIGFSLYSPSELEILLDRKVEFNLLQIPRNILDRKFEPYLKDLHNKGVEIHVRSTFLQGLFFKDRNNLPVKLQPLKDSLLELDQCAVALNLSVAELALSYNLQNPYLSGVLIGVDNVEQLRTNIRSISDKKFDVQINIKEKELLNPVNWN